MTNPRFQTTRQVAAAGVGVLAAITALAYLAGLGPLLSAKSARAAVIDQARSAQAQADALAGLLRAAESRNADLAGAIRQAKVILQPATAINSRLQEIVAILAAKGMLIETQQQDPPDYRQRRFGTVPIRIRARGDYQQCTALLHALNGQFKDLGIDSLELSGNPTESQRTLSVSLGLVWFVAAPTAEQ